MKKKTIFILLGVAAAAAVGYYCYTKYKADDKPATSTAPVTNKNNPLSQAR